MKLDKPLIIILGPTASGKTAFAIKLAKKFNGEIISADSRTIYEKMDLGTAKPTKEEQSNTLYHLLNIIEPDRKFSVAEFQKLAYQKINQIHKKNKIPFLVGGTGLYIDAVSEGFIIPKTAANEKLRKKLTQKPLSELVKKLQKLDSQSAKKIDLKNKRRVIRALEVCLSTGKKFSKLQKRKKTNLNILKIGLKISRVKLYQKINQRTDEMINKGLIKEVKKLYQNGYDFSSPGMSSLGYRQFADYFQGKISREQAIELIKQETRQYAKRQITWFKRDQNIEWIINYQQAENLISNFLNQKET